MINFASKFFTVTLALALCASTASAQPAPAAAKPAPDATAENPPRNPLRRQNPELCPSAPSTSTTSASKAKSTKFDRLAIRFPPPTRSSWWDSKNAVVVHTTPEDLALAEKLLNDLDRPEKTIASPTPSLSWISTRPPSTMHGRRLRAGDVAKQGSKIHQPPAPTAPAVSSAGVSSSSLTSMSYELRRNPDRDGQ